MGRIKSNDDVFYYIGWALLILAGLFTVFVAFFADEIPLKCVFHRLTGFYCPGCGGTRAVKALLKGDILGSLYCHPAVLPTGIFVLIYMGRNTVSRLLRSGKIKPMKMRNIYIFIFIALLIANVVMKNIWGFNYKI